MVIYIYCRYKSISNMKAMIRNLLQDNSLDFVWKSLE